MCKKSWGSEALAAGFVTRQTLRTKYVKLHYNVYARSGMPLDAADRARAAWLWSRRKATLVGSSAAAMHGSLWLPADAPAELARARQPAPPGVLIHRGAVAADEICLVESIYCTTPPRTAYDVGRRVPADTSIIRIDALLNATRCGVADVSRIADRYPGARGIRRLRTALDLADGGAESPKETELRLLLVRDGLPRPATQIRVGRRPNARSESSTTASNIGPIPGGTPKTSSDWNTLPGRAGPLFGSAPGNSDTTVPAS